MKEFFNNGWVIGIGLLIIGIVFKMIPLVIRFLFWKLKLSPIYRYIKSKPIDYQIKKCSDSFYFLGVSGSTTMKDTVVIEKFKQLENGSIRILLLDPESDVMTKRAEDENKSPAEFKNQIKGTIESLKHLQSQYPSIKIELKLYDTYPIWRMVSWSGKRKT